MSVGLPIYQEACEFYKVKTSIITSNEFRSRIASCEKMGSSEYWCVYNKGTNEAVALAINTVYEDCCEYNTM